MRGTKHTRRLDSLGKIEEILAAMTQELIHAGGPNGTPLTLQQKVGMTFAIAAVQKNLNAVRIWSA